MTELLPCPFCGGEAVVCEGGINGRMTVYGLVEHGDGCFFLVDGLPTKNQHIMESDFAAWNTRAERTCHDEGDPCDFCCSECGARMFTDVNDTYTMIANDEQTIIKHPNYCPNCGCKVVDA